MNGQSCGAQRLTVWAVGVSLLAGWAAVALGAEAAVVPRYKFSPGQELVYRIVKQPEDEKDPQKNRRPDMLREWTIDVVKQNADGSWRMLFRDKMSYGSNNEYFNEGYFDLRPDGTWIENRTLTAMGDPTLLFPPLPPDAEAAHGTWSGATAFNGTTYAMKAPDGPPAADGAEWKFAGTDHNPFEVVYLMTTDRDYTFDVARGLVTKIVTTYTQGWPEGRSAEPTKQIVELASVEKIAADDLAALDGEATRFFAALEEVDKLTTRAERDFAHSAELMDQAETRLKQMADEFKLPIVQSIVERKLKSFADSRKYTLENAEKFGALIDKPSAEWKTTDLDGNPKSLADYRGQVVLLDFWYRGCGWCIRAMPQIKQLVDDFKDQKVTVLGMNNDRKLDDARFVIEKLGLNYATLKNAASEDEGINKHYAINGWPTLVVLDGQGVVRHIHVGYSPTLRQDLSETIRGLLAENDKAAK